jgi:hypothetical protein
MLTSCDVGLFGGLPSAAMALQLHRRAHGMLLRLFARIRYAADDGLVGEGYHHTNQALDPGESTAAGPAVEAVLREGHASERRLALVPW